MSSRTSGSEKFEDLGPSLVSGSKMLSQLGLDRNPYVDRTAEKTMLQTKSFYLHSDLQGFKPSETTYIFFGRRGSGKTTIRLMMMEKYEEYNKDPSNELKKIFVVDLSKPGYVQNCLKAFMINIGADEDNWDARFSDKWTSADVADCFISCAINTMMKHVSHNTREGQKIIKHLSKDQRTAKQFLLLAHLFTQEDSRTLKSLRKVLFSSSEFAPSVAQLSLIGSVLTGLASVATLISAQPKEIVHRKVDVPISAQIEAAVKEVPEDAQQGMAKSFSYAKSWFVKPKESVEPKVEKVINSEPETTVTKVGTNYVKLIASIALFGVTIGLSTYGLIKTTRAIRLETERVNKLLSNLKVISLNDSQKTQLRYYLQTIASKHDSAETISRLYIGEAAQQKLELLNSLCVGCGYNGGVAVFGDCFDEVGLLDPMNYSNSLKAFAREVCKNDILNQGRLHFFFPDSRAALDLSTDRVVKEARFDRHFVRDLHWSRHQLLDLAERRFLSAQSDAEELADAVLDGSGKSKFGFGHLFEKVSKEDFSASIGKLSTPRELMVFMTELLARVEAKSGEEGKKGGSGMVAAQDMEIAVNKAQAQSV